MGGVLGACAGLFGVKDDELVFEDEVNERLAVEELLQDAAGEGFPVEISIECRDLPDKDKFSKSDPYVVAKKDEKDGRRILGKTEIIQNNLSPMFCTAIMDTFSVSEDHTIYFTCYHKSSDSTKDSDQQILGSASVLLSNVIKASPERYIVPLVDPGSSRTREGTLILTAAEVHNVQEEVTIELKGHQLKIGRQAPHAFVTILRVQHNRLIPVVKTNIIRSSDPEWKQLKVKAYRLCMTQDDLPLQFQVQSADPSGSHKYIGSLKTTLSELLSRGRTRYPVLNERFLGNKKYVNSGEIEICRATRSAPHSFLDYVRKGFEINCTLAVDLSLSNTTESVPSLHFIDPQDPFKKPNHYMKALRSVCKVVGRYDKDQMFPVYGFGAAVGDDPRINHCFPISLDDDDIEIQGADAIIDMYLQCLSECEPLEPTHMSPVIREVMKVAYESSLERIPSYQLLVILTDGSIGDLTETIDAAVDASFLPMSILIVGMGDPEKKAEGFKNMAALDDPKRPLKSVVTGKTMQRDIVNFIEFDEYIDQPPNDFARAALAEVPSHFLSWIEMSKFDIKAMDDTSGQTEQQSNERKSSYVPPNVDVAKLIRGGASRPTRKKSAEPEQSDVLSEESASTILGAEGSLAKALPQPATGSSTYSYVTVDDPMYEPDVSIVKKGSYHRPSGNVNPYGPKATVRPSRPLTLSGSSVNMGPAGRGSGGHSFAKPSFSSGGGPHPFPLEI